MSTDQLPLRAAAYINRQVFSDHYLTDVLPNLPNWKQLAGEASRAMEEISAILSSARPTAGESEAQTEERIVRPVLQALGHMVYEVQPGLRAPGRVLSPDYMFYEDEAKRSANSGRTLSPELLDGKAYAVGDAKHWDRSLDVSLRGSDIFTNANPSYQIYAYLTYSGQEWGILTNGRLWRLYHRDTAHQLDRFYEVDLPELIDGDDPQRFLFFYAFFRRAAFEPGPISLSAILAASVDYARDVSDGLEEQVYLALRHIAQGFLDYKPNGLQPRQETLHNIYDASLIVLYRLLFILYAEARGLLPLSESDVYRLTYSCQAIKQEVARDVTHGRRFASNAAVLWQRLQQLFRLIDQGDEDMGIATFNGGLFDPDRHPFLEEYAVGDVHLYQALDQLARVDVQGRREFVDYRDLSIRHLGSIYEGLLEHRLSPNIEDSGWTIGLRTDADERHSTGSYYTPEPIVRYIVEQAVRPALDEVVAGKATDQEKVDAILSVNVLDPAMGSGHFLVEATDFIARYLVELNLVPDEDQGEETELAYWKRRVVQSCVYGVDLNGLAVELAKLSLWLNTVQKGRPLSFLDHHLRVGNALIGARLQDLREMEIPSVAVSRQKRTANRTRERSAVAAGQLSMLETPVFQASLREAVVSMQEIEASAALAIEDVKAQERAYEQLRQQISKYIRVADLMLASHFGMKMSAQDRRLLAAYMLGRSIATSRSHNRWMGDIADVAEQYHFFHWELEFPEVFFGPDGSHLGEDAGFDAVVGNPPYINANELNLTLTQYEKPFWKKRFSTAKGAYDIYVLFIEQCLQLARTGRIVSLITPNKYLAAPYAKQLREHLFTSHTIQRLRDVSRIRVFDDASVYPIISVLRRGQDAKSYAIFVEQVWPESERELEFSSDLLGSFNDYIWGFLLTERTDLLSKITKDSVLLAHVSQVNASTTTAEADEYGPHISEDGAHPPRDEWKLINTGTIDRYETTWGRKALAHQRQQYLRPVLPKRSSAVSANRKRQYSTPKLVFAKLALRIEAFVDDVGEYASMNRNFAIAVDGGANLWYLAAIVNSRLMSWVYEQYFGALAMGGGYIQYQAPQLRVLPIRSIDFRTPADQRNAILSKLDEVMDQEGYQAAMRLITAQVDCPEVLHDVLVRLAPRVAALKSQRVAAVERFVLDLEGALPAKDFSRLNRLWTVPRNGVGAEAEQILGDLAQRNL